MTKIDEIKMLRLGQRDENLAREIQMDASEWLELYPGASIQILFRRPGESTITPMITTLIGTTLTWQINDFEVGITGVGNAEIRAVDTAGLRRKSRIIPCSIEDTLLGDDETVLYTQDQVDVTLANIGQAAESALAAKASEEAAALSAENASGSADAAQAAQDAAESARDAAQAAQTAAEEAEAAAESSQDGAAADAQAAEEARITAQAAQASAQGAASQAAADRVAAESARANAEAVAEHAEAVVEGIDQAGADQVAAVQAAGQAQVTEVNQAGTTQVGNVNAAGTTQVNAVQAKGTQVINSIPADYSALSEDVTDLKSALMDQLEPNYMVELVKGASANTSGPLMPFRIHAGDSVTVSSKDGSTFGNVQFRYYDADKKYVDYWGLYATHVNSRTFTISKEAYYVGITTVILESPDAYIVVNNSNAYKQNIKAIEDVYKSEDEIINNRLDIISEQSVKADIINRFNKETITAGKYINPNTGGLATNETFFASDFIYIGDLASVTVSYTHLFVWYDENKNHLTPNPDPMNSGPQDLTFARPEGAVYLRFSAYNDYLNTAQIGGAVSRNNYAPYGMYKLPELRVSQSQIDTSGDSRVVVDASGGGDYTSFTQAIYETVDDGTDVFVKPGTYDIVAEYIALFGQTAVDNMADADSSTFNGFQYGVRLRKRKVEFAPGAHLVCDWTGHTVDGTHRFSALGVDYNVEIIGLDLDVTATFYCIHDDYGIATPYTVKYENCRVIGHNIKNANCIGGGCKKFSRHILNNCYFDNNLTNSATVRYHNTNGEGSEPEIYVSNCYFSNWFTPRWYGTQTSKMRVYVNNCHARAIYKMAESSSYNVDNVELYKWNNEETDPRT